MNDRLQDYLARFKINVIATDASSCEEKAGVGIYSPSLNWSFSLRLPDYTSVFHAELLAIVLALRKLPIHITRVIIVTDSLSVCSALTASTKSPTGNTFYSLAPPHLSLVHIVWVPGHRDIDINEKADSLARASLAGPVLFVLPATAHITAARYRRFSLSEDEKALSLAKSSDFLQLNYSWNRQWCPNRKFEVSLTRLRCRIPSLNFYLHRCGLAVSPLCYLCVRSDKRKRRKRTRKKEWSGHVEPPSWRRGARREGRGGRAQRSRRRRPEIASLGSAPGPRGTHRRPARVPGSASRCPTSPELPLARTYLPGHVSVCAAERRRTEADYSQSPSHPEN
ncbi:uncharacterized protein [Dermacentor andersoni]|uniref:uncharacterized protein n=1 Tax=Dermacentor andersoni TaxID=34620 RepID=UPI003B3B8F01